MKLRQVGSNQTILIIDADTTVLFSYETPVAALVRGTYFRTSEKYSTTTSRHISQWLGGVRAESRDPEFFTSLVNGESVV
jgi:hypothetical protein